MELFQNPNIASVLVERLPCAFAPTVNGKMGTHYAMVLLDKNNNVLYVGSECEHKHGESVQAIHDMGGQDNTLCYVATAAFRKALQALHDSKDIAIDVIQRPKDSCLLENYMGVVFRTVWENACKKHNNRSVAKLFGNPGPTMRRQIAMQRTVNKVSASLLGLSPKEIDCGRPRGNITSNFSIKQVPIFPEVFTVKCAPVNQGHSSAVYHDNYIYRLYFHDDLDAFATRAGGAWTINEDMVKNWAREHWKVNTVAQPVKGDRLCVFCGEQYSRMSKHTQGARHIDRVLEVAKLTCKATSRMGLQMLNNPKTRAVFIKR